MKVDPGEAVFQNAGLPHAYLEGQNIELMANSDNVLRGGLTPKHVDVQELLNQIKFEPTSPNIMSGNLQVDGLERIYDTPVRDFRLSKIEIEQASVYHSTSQSLEILIIIKGDAHLEASEKSISVGKGEVVAITHGTQYRIKSSDLVVFKATARMD